MAVAEPAATTQFLLTAFSFAALTYAFVTSDFSLSLVVANSHTAKPMIYKISGRLGESRGLAPALGADPDAVRRLRGMVPARTCRRRSRRACSRCNPLSPWRSFAFHPVHVEPAFTRLAAPPFDGQDLNPLLQDPGLAFHPPFLYLGYVGLSMAFSFAVAALIEGRVDAAWWPLGAALDRWRPGCF